MSYKATLEAREELIDLKKLDIAKLEDMMQIALEFENYKMCSYIQKIINKKNEQRFRNMEISYRI